MLSTLVLFVDSLLSEGDATEVTGIVDVEITALFTVLFTGVVFSLELTVLLTFEGVVALSSLALT